MSKPDLSEAAVTAAARALCKINAETCNVNEQDSWKIYSEDFKTEARAVLAAALPALSEQRAEPTEAQLLALALEHPNAPLLPQQKAAALNRGREAWARFVAAGGEQRVEPVGAGEARLPDCDGWVNEDGKFRAGTNMPFDFVHSWRPVYSANTVRQAMGSARAALAAAPQAAPGSAQIVASALRRLNDLYRRIGDVETDPPAWMRDALHHADNILAPQAAPGSVPEDAAKLSADLTHAKNLLVKLWDRHPEARALIEGHTGSWFVWGVDRNAAPTNGEG